MARTDCSSAGLGAIHPRFQTPHRAIVLQAIWSSVLVATGTFRQLFTRVIYTEWIFFGLMAVGTLPPPAAARLRAATTGCGAIP